MIKADPVEVGQRICYIRTRKLGMTMDEFAKKVDDDLTKSSISNWENGHNLPSNKRAKKIADLWEMSIDELLNGSRNFYQTRLDNEMAKVDPKRTGRRIRRIRINRGLTMQALGKMLQVSTESVRDWENGKNLPNENNLKSISNLWGIPEDELLYGGVNKIKIKRLSPGHYMAKIDEAKVEFDFESLAEMGAFITKMLAEDYFESVAGVIHEFGEET